MNIFGFSISRIKKNPIKAASSMPTILPSSSFLPIDIPVWRNLTDLHYLLKCYCENPIVQAVINIKAKALSNIRFSVKDLKTGELIPLHMYTSDKGKLKSLISQPNPLQSTYEWLSQYSINRHVFGNSYIYASVPISYESDFTYQDINVINNLPPYCIAPVLTGKWLDATEKDEIIKHYEFTFNGRNRKFHTNTILHLNSPNIKINETFTQGQSLLLALRDPISNIDKAYESRNVLINKRGALGILTSEKKDEATGHIPLNETEVEDVQEAFKKYGLLDDQYSQIISPHPLKYQKMAQSVRELMLFEEIEADAITICNSFGVPELLVKQYVQGSTFANLDTSEKRLYDSTIIPESEEFMVAFNNYLRTEEFGIELVGSFDHLNALQINKKELATTNKIKQDTFLDAFKIGAITYGVYLNAIGLDADGDIENMRVWDLSTEQLRAIGIVANNNSKSNNNDTE